MQAYQLLPTLGQWAMTGATRHGPSCALPAPAINHTAQGARKVSNAVTKAGAGLCRRESPSHNGGGGLCLVWSVARPIRAGLVPTPGFFLGFFCINFPQATPVRSTRRSSSISHWGLSTLLSDLQRMHGGNRNLKQITALYHPLHEKNFFKYLWADAAAERTWTRRTAKTPSTQWPVLNVYFPLGRTRWGFWEWITEGKTSKGRSIFGHQVHLHFKTIPRGTFLTCARISFVNVAVSQTHERGFRRFFWATLNPIF